MHKAVAISEPRIQAGQMVVCERKLHIVPHGNRRSQLLAGIHKSKRIIGHSIVQGGKGSIHLVVHVLVRYVLKQMFGLLQSYGRTFEIIIGKTYHPGIERGKTLAVLITVLYEIAGGLIQQRVGSIGMPLLERRLRQQQYITGIVIAVHFFRF